MKNILSNGDNIAELFPIQDKGLVEFEDALFNLSDFDYEFGEFDQLKKLIEAVDPANPWMLARIENLLAFEAKGIDPQQPKLIIALGSVGILPSINHRVQRVVPCLSVGPRGHHLHLCPMDGEFDTRYHFLVVRKKSQQ